MLPVDLLNTWLIEEQKAGAPDPCLAVLSTATKNAVPHARIVAIREINEQGLLFFTQQGTRKVDELNANPQAAMTFWFELHQRETIIEGLVEPLPVSPLYCGFRLKPSRIVFYAYRIDELSDVFEYRLQESNWTKRWLSP